MSWVFGADTLALGLRGLVLPDEGYRNPVWQAGPTKSEVAERACGIADDPGPRPAVCCVAAGSPTEAGGDRCAPAFFRWFDHVRKLEKEFELEGEDFSIDLARLGGSPGQ